MARPGPPLGPGGAFFDDHEAGPLLFGLATEAPFLIELADVPGEPTRST